MTCTTARLGKGGDVGTDVRDWLTEAYLAAG